MMESSVRRPTAVGESEFKETAPAQASVMYTYILKLRYLLHNKKPEPLDLSEVFRIFTLVTLRQVLTSLTQTIHMRTGGED